jgi:hypothetical protein
MKTVLFIGDSHLNCIEKAAQDGAAERMGLHARFIQTRSLRPLVPHAKAPGREPRVNRQLRALLAELKATHTAFLALRGNTHVMLGLCGHARDYDFSLRGEPSPALVPGSEVVPLPLVEATLASHLDVAFLEMRALRAEVQCPLVLLESPPPVPAAAVLQHPGKFADEIAQSGVAPDGVRYKLWRVQSSLMRAACEKLGMGYLPVPRQAVDGAGCLAAHALTDSATHANAWYGERVLEQAAEHCAAGARVH